MNITMAWGMLIRLINSACSTGSTTGYAIESGGGPYSSGHLNALWQMHTFCSENSTRFMNVSHHSHITNLLKKSSSCMVEAKWVLAFNPIKEKDSLWQFKYYWIKYCFIHCCQKKNQVCATEKFYNSWQSIRSIHRKPEMPRGAISKK